MDDDDASTPSVKVLLSAEIEGISKCEFWFQLFCWVLHPIEENEEISKQSELDKLLPIPLLLLLLLPIEMFGEKGE